MPGSGDHKRNKAMKGYTTVDEHLIKIYLLDKGYENPSTEYNTINDLLPVVEEIHSDGAIVEISSNGITKINSLKNTIVRCSHADNHMFDSLLQAIVLYIKLECTS